MFKEKGYSLHSWVSKNRSIFTLFRKTEVADLIPAKKFEQAVWRQEGGKQQGKQSTGKGECGRTSIEAPILGCGEVVM